MSLLTFYNHGAELYGYTLESILEMTDDEFEKNHDFIQLMFPNREPSQFNFSAPIMDDEFVKHVDHNIVLKSCIRWFNFLGLELYDLSLNLSIDWAVNSKRWLTLKNHNYLRITRVLKFLKEINSELHLMFSNALIFIYHQYCEIIGPITFAFWKGAMHEDTIY